MARLIISKNLEQAIGANYTVQTDGSGNLQFVTSASLVTANETALVVNTDGNSTGVSQSGVNNHTVNITLLSTDANNDLTVGTDGGIYYADPGGGTDDQVASEVPFTPTGNTTSTNVQAAIEELQTDIDNISDTDDQTAAEVPSDDTNFDVITGTDVQTNLESIDDALLAARSTGVQTWGSSGLINQGLGVIRIEAGTGTIFDNTVPSAPVYYNVSWVQTDLDLSAVDDLYYIYVDNAGTVTSTTTEQSHSEYRTRIQLGRVSIRSGLVVGFVPTAMPTQNETAQIWDLWRAYGATHKGILLSGDAADLTLDHSAGEIYQPGISLPSAPLSPHELEVLANANFTFRHVDQDNDQSADTTLLDVTNYDNGGVVTAIPGSANQAQIFLVFTFATSPLNIRILRGQTIYSTLNAAIDAIAYDYNPIIPSNFDNANFLGYIVATKGATATDSANVRIFNNIPGRGGTAISAAGTSISITDGTTTEVISNGDTITFAEGEGISLVVSATDTVTVSQREVVEEFNVTSVDGSTVTLAGTPPTNENLIRITRNGLAVADADWSIAGSVITFTDSFGGSTNGTDSEQIIVRFSEG